MDAKQTVHIDWKGERKIKEKLKLGYLPSFLRRGEARVVQLRRIVYKCNTTEP